MFLLSVKHVHALHTHTHTLTQPHLLLPVQPVWRSVQHERYVQHRSIHLWQGSLSESIDVWQAHSPPKNVEA